MAAQEDLLAQRNKIQRQILALETSLAADSNIADLLSSDSDSDNASDDDDGDSGHAGGKEVQDVLEAERQQILQEIKELEQTLGPNAALIDGLTDSDHGSGSRMDSNDEDSDDEELYLPQDIETCLQMNLVYQEVLKEKLADLERLLNENRQQQEEIEAQLSGPSSSSKQPHSKLFLGSFMKPYFKDKLTGLGPPSNEETRERHSHGKKPCDEMNIRRWNGWHKTLLVDSVVKDTMKRMLQPKMSKVEYLTGKLSKAEDAEKEELSRQIALIQQEIKDISSLKEDQLYGSRWDDHDWEKISNIDFEGLRHSEDLKRFWQNYLHPSINKSAWNQEEIEKLSAIVEQYKRCHWDEIAEALGTNRSACMCFQTYQRYISKSFRKRLWTKEEDQILRDLVEKMRIGNFIPYTQMSYFMEGRDHAQLMYRWTAVLDPSIKRGPWSKEEDQLLLKAVEKFGCKDWYKIRLEVPGRTDNACRDRYLDSLRDDVKKGTWSEEEVELLKKLVEKYGVGKWTKIASEIPNRIDAQCLNKWKAMAARKGVKRNVKRSNQGARPKKRKVIKKQIEVEEEEEEEEIKSDSTSEDENVNVEYLDSDGERPEVEKLDVPSEEEMDLRAEYIQPDIKEWIPAGLNACVRLTGTVRTTLVRLPTEEEEQDYGTSISQSVSGSSLTESNLNRSTVVRNTVLDHLGNPVKTYVGIDPPALPMWDCCDENAMDKVPVSDIRHLLILSSKSHNKKARMHRGKKKMHRGKKKMCSAEEQKHAEKHGQDTERARSHPSRDEADMNGLDAQKSHDYALMIAVVPWVGNIMIPLPFSKKRVCEADIVRKRSAVVHLPKTAVFLLFLKALHVDAEGCKKVIEARKTSLVKHICMFHPSLPRHQPKPVIESRPRTAVRYNPSSISTVMTVANLLAERSRQANSPKPPELEQPPPPDQPTKLPIPRNKPRRKPQQGLQAANQIMGPTLMVPYITQSKTHQGVGTPQPVRQGILPLLQSRSVLEVCPPVLQLVVPVEPQKIALSEVPPTTLTFIPSNTASSALSSGEVKTLKTAPCTTSTPTPSTTVLLATSSGEGKTPKAASPTSTSTPSNTVPPATSSEEVKTPKAASPTSSTPSTTVSPTVSSGEGKTPKRICRPTMKAQALIDNAKIKASKKQKLKNSKGSHGETSTAVQPQTTAWILTPAGLMPLGGIHLTPPGILGNQNPVHPNFAPQVPVTVNQNSSFAYVDAVRPSSPTTVSPASVGPGTAKTNIRQNFCVSTISNQPNVSSLPSNKKDPNNSSPVTNAHSAAVVTNGNNRPNPTQGPAVNSKISCSQSQTILSIVPQMAIQSPIIVNQNGSLTLLCDAVPTIPLNSSMSPRSVTSIPVGTSQKSIPSSGLKTTSVNNVLSISPASAGTQAHAVLPVCPSVLTISSPVIQMPSPTLPGSQNPRMSYPQVVFQQPVIAKQSDSMALGAAESSMTTNFSSTPFPNASKDSPNPAALSKNPPPSVTEVPKVSSASSVNNVLIVSPCIAPNALCVPSGTTSSLNVCTSVAGSKISVASEPCVTMNNPPAPFPNASKVSLGSAAPSTNPPTSATKIPKDSSGSSVNNVLIVSPGSAAKTLCAPSVLSSVARSEISVASAASQKNSVSQCSVLSQQRLPVKVRSLPKGQLDANKSIECTTSSCQTFPNTQAPQAKKQPLHSAAPTSNPINKPDSLHFDPNLMFLEHPNQVKDWIKGNGGISLPYLEDKMPYLPPFVSNVNTLASLLKARESLLNTAVQLLPEEHQSSTGEEEEVAAVRKLVSDRFKTNPTYLLLKARFLSSFTMPALLATIHPCKESQGNDSEDDRKDQFVFQIADSLLNTSECEVEEAQFSGISERMQTDHHAVQI